MFTTLYKLMGHVLYHHDKLHANIVLQNVALFQHSKELCDITLIVENEEIRAHKIVLAASSLYFRTMFCGSLMESHQEKIVLHDIELPTFQEIIHFMYTGQIKISEENIYSVISMADFLQIPALSHPCCQYLQTSLCVDNCLSVYQTAIDSGYNDLAHEALRCILRNFSSVCEQPEFLDVTIELLSDILYSDYINIDDESRLLEIFIRWIKVDLEKRAQHIPLIPKMICLDAVPMEKLISVKIDSVMFKTELRSIMDKCIDKILTVRYDDPEQNDLILNEKRPCKFFRYHAEQQVMLVIGGKMDDTTTHASVECFTPGFSQWSYHLPGHKICIKSMRHARSSFATAAKEYDVYVIGGKGESGLLDTFEHYHVKCNTWNLLQNIPKAVEGAAAVIANGKLIVTGGRSMTCYESSTWVFDNTVNKWQQLESMKIRRGFHSCVCVGGMVYALGGIGGDSPTAEGCISKVERLDISQTAWYFVAPMVQARAHFGCVASGQSIYVAGGTSDEIYLRSIERYDTSTDTWCVLKPMQIPRAYFGITVFHNRIYCVGGSDSVHELNTVEKYNPSTDMWHCVISMNVKRVSPSAVTVYIPTFPGELPLGNVRRIGVIIE
ncbi:kelch-like protein 28 isoform X1 [Schistocerca americana]|uniref:kelch-like protein 28 isoform X1 n=2 Tax=Schistocerca americana TaxID=7009 RepID=UPI001F4F98D3|nr:kelch-like protein 28 isoform X1 [Schistocerca americana]